MKGLSLDSRPVVLYLFSNTVTLQALDSKVNSQETRVDSKLEAMLEKLMLNQQNCFGQLEKTNSKAIAELRNEYVTGYTELKEILSNSPKARRVEEIAP